MPNKFVAREQEVQQFWQDNHTFEQSVNQKGSTGDFVFFEGPPTANAAPGVHHVLARAFKDVIPRFATMRGFRVVRKAGWDTHGLPVELQVEKKLGLKSKGEIENIVSGDAHASIAKFNDECKQTVWQFKEEWERLTNRIGFWLDLGQPYITYENYYIESIWSVIKHADQRGLLYQGHKVVPFCTRCGTALSSHEVAQGYKSITEDSVYVKCKVTQGNEVVQPGDYILTWTTTPWTLPGNVALAVGENIDYIKVIYKGEKFIVASGLEHKIFPFGDGDERTYYQGNKDTIIKGKYLVGVQYEPLFPGAVTLRQAQGDKIAWEVVPADFVTTTDGTGVVHTAVMYGEDDYQLGEKVGLPKQHTVGLDGKFLDTVEALAGKYVKDEQTTQIILEHLKKENLLFKIAPYTHDYPFCWRCATPLLYYAKDSWFIKMTSLQKELLKNANDITWVPEHIKQGRFGEWIAGIKDWAISRERYWGSPLPVWQGNDGKNRLVIGGLEHLYEKAVKKNEFFMMRHGQAENNVKQLLNYDVTASHQYPITEQGKKEVAATIKELKKLGITKIVSSPLARTQQTAQLVGEALDIAVETNQRLVELGLGPYEGKTEPDLRADYPARTDFFRPGSQIETPDAAAARILQLIAEINRDNQGQKILLVSHGDPIYFTQLTVRGYNLHTEPTLPYLETAGVASLPVLPELITQDGQYNLHRPYIDDVVLVDGDVELRRIPEVLDVWLDSGAMPFAQYHYPFENKAVIDKKQQFPADYISEAIDQTRGWFYTLLAVATILGKGAPYKNVICLGHINDASGQKMSKSKGNIVNPWQVIDEYGADALRWYLYTINQPGDAKNFDIAGVADAARKPMLLLENVLSFYQLYAAGQAISTPKPDHLLDRWVLTRLDQLIELVTKELERYHIIESARAIDEFVDELSTWFVRRSRDRFKAGDKMAVTTLGYTLKQVAGLLAPFIPFYAESLYQQLGFKESVHMSQWPEPWHKKFDKTVLAEMEIARKIVERGLAARAGAGIKVRQPLQSYTTDLAKKLSEQLIAIITDELNIKQLLFGAEKLDTTISAELAIEGLSRELIRQVNQLRKDQSLTIQDHITIIHEKLEPVVDAFRDEIMQATLADAIEGGTTEPMRAVGAGRVGIKTR